jgi:hypothetical protein
VSGGGALKAEFARKINRIHRQIPMFWLLPVRVVSSATLTARGVGCSLHGRSARRPAIADTPPSHFRHSGEEPDRWHKRLPRWRFRGDAGTREERREDRNCQDVASWRFDLIPLRVACVGGVWRIAIRGIASLLGAVRGRDVAQRKGRFGLVKSPQPRSDCAANLNREDPDAHPIRG